MYFIRHGKEDNEEQEEEEDEGMIIKGSEFEMGRLHSLFRGGSRKCTTECGGKVGLRFEE